MNQNQDEELAEFVDQINDDLKFSQNELDIRNRSRSTDSKSQRKFLILGSAVVVLLIILVLVLSLGGKDSSQEEVAFIKGRLGQLEVRLKRLEVMDNRIAALEKQENGLQQSIEENKRSGKVLTQRVNKLAKSIALLDNTVATVTAKVESPGPLPKGTIPKMMSFSLPDSMIPWMTSATVPSPPTATLIF